jgi:hypothetical protein
MIVVAAGLMRSGSTWQFNALRLIMEAAGLEDVGTGFVNDLDDVLHHRHLAIKTHVYLPALNRIADHVLTSHRDVRDAFASLVRFDPNRKPSPGEVFDRSFRHYRAWAAISDYDMPYETMVQRPLEPLRQIADVLGLGHLDLDPVLEKLERIKPPVEKTDPDRQNLLWTGHITDGRIGSFHETLERSQLLDIERKYGRWLTRHGYALGEEVES